jgi:hypothetical protein
MTGAVKFDQGKALLSFSGNWLFFFKCTGGDLHVMLPQKDVSRLITLEIYFGP